MPFKDKEFDLVFCGETLEHIPEDVCLEILKEVQRVSGSFYFTIATHDDAPYNMHINVHPAWWWQRVFGELGFRVIHAQDHPIVPIVYGNGGIMKLRFPDGVTMYGYCDIKE
jgi:ubiquinone/menaquinone biosynthesis C-methylase UbiE